MTDIAALVERVTGIRWAWDEAGMEPALKSMNATLVEEVPGRRTYVTAGLRASVYLEQEQVECLEITVDAFLDPLRLSLEEYEQKVDEYFSKYEEAVATAKGILGPPVFNDGGGNEGFPDDQEAVWLAQWDLPTARFMVQQKHEDRELPFRLCVVLAPPLEAS